jgi:hypothetical protein
VDKLFIPVDGSTFLLSICLLKPVRPHNRIAQIYAGVLTVVPIEFNKVQLYVETIVGHALEIVFAEQMIFFFGGSNATKNSSKTATYGGLCYTRRCMNDPSIRPGLVPDGNIARHLRKIVSKCVIVNGAAYWDT